MTADVIFAGEVIRVEESVELTQYRYHFEVSAWWRGGDSEMTVAVKDPMDTCQRRFKKGTVYLVYGEVLGGRVIVDACSGTTYFASAFLDRYLLGQPSVTFSAVDIVTLDDLFFMLRDPELSRVAVLALGALPDMAGVTLPVLAGIAKGHRAGDPAAAMDAIGRLGWDARLRRVDGLGVSEKALENAYREMAYVYRRRHLYGDDLRAKALDTMRALNPDDRDLAGVYLSALNDTSSAIRAAGARGVGRLGSRAYRNSSWTVAKKLVRNLDSNDSELLRSSMGALCSFRAQARRAKPKLREIQESHPDPDVRKKAGWSLECLGEESTAAGD
jgi:hypothetical protein